MNIGELFVRIRADASGLTSAMDQASRRLERTGRQMQNIGKGLTAGVTLPIVGIGVAATKMAADAAESASKMEAVFGDATGSMNTWISELQATVPATRAQLQGMTSEIQDLLVPLGMAPDAAQEMTQQVTQLAADLASFNNIPMEEALRKIRSGMVGQYEPLLSFGVALNAATVEAKALEMGLIAQGEKLTPLARAQASLALTVENTSAAHGDAAKTAESAANSFKFLVRDAKELAVTIGDILLPVVIPMVQNLTKTLGALRSLSPEAQKTIVVVAALAAAVGPLILALGTIVRYLPIIKLGFAALTGPIGLTVAAIAALTTAWVIWGDDIKRIVGETVSAVREWFSNVLGGVFDGLRQKVEAVTGFFADMYDAVVGNSYVPDMVLRINEEFLKLDRVMVQPAQAAAAQVNEAFAGIQGPNIGSLLGIGSIGSLLASLNPVSMAVNMGLSAASGLIRSGIQGIFGRITGTAERADTAIQGMWLQADRASLAMERLREASSNVPTIWDNNAARRTVHGGSTSRSGPVGVGGGTTVHIHNPPRGMDVVAVADQVAHALVQRERLGGTTEFGLVLNGAR